MQTATKQSIFDKITSPIIASLFSSKRTSTRRNAAGNEPEDDSRKTGRFYMPYCVERLSGDQWIILNRNYKPLGCVSRQYVDYSNYAVPLAMTQKRADLISHKSVTLTGKDDFLFLYNDGCCPFYDESTAADKDAYYKRLSALMDIQTRIHST